VQKHTSIINENIANIVVKFVATLIMLTGRTVSMAETEFRHFKSETDILLGKIMEKFSRTRREQAGPGCNFSIARCRGRLQPISSSGATRAREGKARVGEGGEGNVRIETTAKGRSETRQET
jgi:hypothetical protein